MIINTIKELFSNYKCWSTCGQLSFFILLLYFYPLCVFLFSLFDVPQQTHSSKLALSSVSTLLLRFYCFFFFAFVRLAVVVLCNRV
jgi:magnesium-transporting ATPase (P-type)